jgi:hypothetical protein
MDILCITKCRYEIQEQKEIPVRYTGIYDPVRTLRTILSFDKVVSYKALETSKYILLMFLN